MTVRQLWRLWSALLVVGMVFVFALDSPFQASTPSLPTPEPMAAIPTLTDLPALIDEEELAAAHAELLSTQLWGEVAKETTTMQGPAPEKTGWSLSGVFMVGDSQRFVILVTAGGNEPSRQLEEGDPLPNGDTILAIKRDKVQVQTKAKDNEYWIPINRTGDTKK